MKTKLTSNSCEVVYDAKRKIIYGYDTADQWQPRTFCSLTTTGLKAAWGVLVNYWLNGTAMSEALSTLNYEGVETVVYKTKIWQDGRDSDV